MKPKILSISGHTTRIHRSIYCSFFLITGSLGFGPFAHAETIDFNAMKPGPLPSGWEIVVPGGYSGGKRLPGVYERDLYGVEAASKLETTPKADWQIVPDKGTDALGKGMGNLLQASSRATDTWCVKSDVNIRDGYVEVEGNSEAGVPQHTYSGGNTAAIGVVWRYQDAKNFYAAYLSGSTLKLVKMVDGDFGEFEVSPPVKALADQWHVLRVEFSASLAKVMLNGREVFAAADRDIRKGGGVGIFLRGDASARFDNLDYGAYVSSETETFDAMKLSSPPPAPWQYGNARDLGRLQYPLGSADWQVVRVRRPRPGTNVLRQSALGVQPYCAKTDVKIRDGYVEVDAKAISGEFAQSMGVTWRWQDEKNYYLARANAKEDTVTVFRVVDGRRRSLGRSRLIHIPAHEWHTLRVDFSGNRIVARFNGGMVVSVTDDSINRAGAVGLWTKLDAHILFDNLSWGEN